MMEFKQRLELTECVEGTLNMLFDSRDTGIHPFGCESIVQGNEALYNYLIRPKANQESSALIIKFAPDFIFAKLNEPQELFFLDVKHSVSPLYSERQLKKLQEKSNDSSLTIDRIGVIAREALLAYRRYYPKTIILMACSYNPKVLMAQFVNKIRCLYCYHDKSKPDYICDDCPSKTGGFFEIERATNAAGSQTPMTTVDLNSFQPAEEFFSEMGIQFNQKVLYEIMKNIREEGVQFSENVNEKTRQEVIYKLNRAGCDWLSSEVYSIPGNDFYHRRRDCYCLKTNQSNIQTYSSPLGAEEAGLRKCKFCFDK